MFETNNRTLLTRANFSELFKRMFLICLRLLYASLSLFLFFLPLASGTTLKGGCSHHRWAKVVGGVKFLFL